MKIITPICSLLLAALISLVFADRAAAQVSIPYTNNFEFDFPGGEDPDFTTSSTFTLATNGWQIVTPGIAFDGNANGNAYQSAISNNQSTIYNTAEVQATTLPGGQGFVLSSDFQIPQFSAGASGHRSHIGLLAFGNYANEGFKLGLGGTGSFVWPTIQISASTGNGPGSLVWVNFVNGGGNNTGISLGSQVGANLPMNTTDTYTLTLIATYDVNTNIDLTFIATDDSSNLTASISEVISYATATNSFISTSLHPLNGTYFGICNRIDASGTGHAGQTEVVLQDNFSLNYTNSTPGGLNQVLNTTLSPYAARFVGASVSADATFSGQLPIYYTWEYTDTNHTTTNFVSVTSTNDVDLALNNLQLPNMGFYRLFASNSVSTLASSWDFLTVVSIPTNPVVNVDIRNGLNPAYQGIGVLGTVADLWNAVDGSATAATNSNIPLYNSTGVPTSVELSFTPGIATTINSSLVRNIFDQYNQNAGTNTVTLSGLQANTSYDIVVYSIGGSFEGGTFSGAITGVATGGAALVSNTGGFTNNVNYVENRSAMSDGSGNLTFYIAPNPGDTYGDFDALQITTSPAHPTVAIQPLGGGQVQVTFSGGLGQLLQATNIVGPWTTNTAISPYVVTPTPATPQMFFKAQ